MPLGNVLGEFSAKITSLKQTELSGGQLQIEMNTVGEGTGQVPGRTMATMEAEVTPGKPSPFQVTGVVMPAAGAPTRFSAWGIGVGGAQSHQVRLRGAIRYLGDDPKTATLIGAVEAEIDLKEMTIKGAVCEWT
jgi:hypothetical protein